MLSRRAKLAAGAVWVLFWLLLITTEVQDYLRRGHHQVWQPVLWSASSGITATLLTLAQRHFTRRHDHLLATPLRWFGRQFLWLPVYWASFVPLTFGMRHAVYALAGDTYHHEAWVETFLYENVKISVFFGTAAVVLFGILSYHALLQEQLRAERAKGALRQAQLLRLTQQMQPHFLFNALNTISSLMHEDVGRADTMLIQLADVLRATLELNGRHEAPLATELRLLRAYAGLMRERFSDRVSIDWHIDETLLACPVPVMSLQPLLENIFKHTVERRRQPVRISIAASREGGQLVLRMDDDGGTLAPNAAAAALAPAGAATTPSALADAAAAQASGAASSPAGAADGGGIGLANLRERLLELHGERAGLTLSALAPAGVRAELRLPCAC
ncbi:sensor histidine kinase [Rugamonas sp. DEMB1]|uniref:sensor histidine kinase n=1 Tax=Rugamonas sp. DEMB1 TaxID=3039386 RepID=UPI00244BC913|nr:histidine kinase [Rugamonas sp. DEMB1]WGG48460.1 histidine kinase [Rugamonas sp. DEMB1]